MLKANLVLVSGLMLASAAAFAAKAGDTAVMNVTASKGDQTQTSVVTLKITKTDEAQKLYLLERTQQSEGQEATKSEEWKTEAEIGGSEAQVNEALEKCAEAGGVSENITVPAGSFDVCSLPLADDLNQVVGKLSVGKVAFGIVRLEQTTEDDVKVVAELVSYEAGK